ncbi:M64 family metallopeptidase, partial [Bacteroidota bacterium]
DKYFTGTTMRVDYVIAGNDKSCETYFEQIKEEPLWSGTRKNLVDPFIYGEFRMKVFDKESGKLIFSRGYASLFKEWQTTAEAKEITRSFYETVLIPFPLNNIILKLFIRDRNNELQKIFEKEIDPENYFIKKEVANPFTSKKIIDNGKSEEKIDIVFLPDGYTKEEMEKFNNDANKFASKLLATPPFEKYKNSFNIWLVEAPSMESGTDIPGKNIWKNTILNTSFYTFDSERYLMTPDIWSVRNVAGMVAYDQIVILVNTEKYGGGGVYNYYNTFSSDNEKSPGLLVHEFGHGLVGLADEYYSSSTAYLEYYNLEVEPIQPNITTLVNFKSKWKSMIKKKTPIPTPRDDNYIGIIGAFEGGGYVSEGIYSPMIKCKMNWLEDEFCPVCSKAIIEMIKYYTE